MYMTWDPKYHIKISCSITMSETKPLNDEEELTDFYPVEIPILQSHLKNNVFRVLLYQNNL